jgi:hypothetical protein
MSLQLSDSLGNSWLIQNRPLRKTSHLKIGVVVHITTTLGQSSMVRQNLQY